MLNHGIPFQSMEMDARLPVSKYSSRTEAYISYPETDIFDKVFFEFWLLVSDHRQGVLIGVACRTTVFHNLQ